MVSFNLAYTAPINPPDVSPTLTPAQVWKGLERKVRHAQEFVPLITACKVTGEDRSPKLGYPVVNREVQFTGQGPNGDGTPVREICTLLAPARVDFEQPNGSLISNIVSKNAAGELLMTYSFAWVHDGVAEGSAEARELEEKHWNTAKMAVEGSIDTIRRLVKEGQLS